MVQWLFVLRFVRTVVAIRTQKRLQAVQPFGSDSAKLLLEDVEGLLLTLQLMCPSCFVGVRPC